MDAEKATWIQLLQAGDPEYLRQQGIYWHVMYVKKVWKRTELIITNIIRLAKDVSVYFDAIKLFIIQGGTRINTKEVSNCEIPRPPIEVSEEKSQPLPSAV